MERVDIDPRLLQRCSYAVIDPARGESALWGALPVQPLAPPAYASIAPQLPQLLALRGLDARERDRLLAELCDQVASGCEPLVSMLIESEQTPGSIIRHLGRMMVVRAPKDRKPCQFRFHDLCALMQLAWILNGDQLKTLLGPSVAWVFPQEGGWRLRARDGAEVLPALRLRIEQWGQLRCVGGVQAVLARQRIPVERWTDAGRDLFPRFVAARSLGLTDDEDVIAFVMHGMACHPECHRHPRIARILAECEGKPKRYGRIAAMLSESDWQCIAADMVVLSENSSSTKVSR